jgi:predicted RNA polymerase sigma factor
MPKYMCIQRSAPGKKVPPSPAQMQEMYAVFSAWKEKWQGPEAGLAVLDGLAPPAWVSGSYLWDAVLGDLHRRAGHSEIARQHRERALGTAPTDAVRELLRRRLALD